MNLKFEFKTMDLLGPEIKIYSQSSSQLKSNFGALLTLIICTFSIICFIGLGTDMIFKQNPTIFEYRTFNMTTELELGKMPFAIGIMRTGGGVINDLKRKIKIYYRFAITNSSNVNQPTQFKM